MNGKQITTELLRLSTAIAECNQARELLRSTPQYSAPVLTARLNQTAAIEAYRTFLASDPVTDWLKRSAKVG